MSEIKNED